MNIIFYHESEDSLVNYWEVGLKSCGIKNFLPQHKPLSKSQPPNFIPDLIILENPLEFDLDCVSEIKTKQTVCIIGDVYKPFYKNYPFVNLWVEPCFYDKITEKSFSDDSLPFYYCPKASQDCFIPFHTELNREFDLSIDDPLKEPWNIVVISKYDPHPEVIYGNTKVNLNYQIPKKDFVYLNQKAFDIPLSGNFELSTIPEIVDIFESKVGYTSEADMRDKIQYYIDHEEERTRMAIKGYEVCIAKHTYTYRMRNLLKKLQTL
jgi:hypothetical protein